MIEAAAVLLGDSLAPVGARTFRRLRLFNAAMAPVHIAQGIAILALSTDFALPVTTSFLKFDEAARKLVTEDNTLFDLRLAPLVTSFLFISAFDHLLLAEMSSSMPPTATGVGVGGGAAPLRRGLAWKPGLC